MAPKSEICDWQFECSELKQRGAHLLQSGDLSDCSFLVGSEPRAVKAHKLILAMASPVFEVMFYGSMAAEGNKPITIVDVQPETFKALLEYIYTDNITITSFENAFALFYSAKKYMLPHLVNACTRYLWSKINPGNVCQIYELARMLDVNLIMEKCLQVISLNTKEVLKDSSFNDIHYDTMRAIFSQEYLDVDSELDLFQAATNHAKAQSKRSKEEKAVDADSDADSPVACAAESRRAEPERRSGPNAPENRNKPTIRSAIEQIRFLTLSPQQFAEGPARSPLLARSEMLSFFMHISSHQTAEPLPPGFSASREPRKRLAGTGPNVREISLSEPYLNFINQELKARGMFSHDYFSCLCTTGSIPMNDYGHHFFGSCPLVSTERLEFEVICRGYKVDPFSEDVKNHKDTMEALHNFMNQIKLRPKTKYC